MPNRRRPAFLAIYVRIAFFDDSTSIVKNPFPGMNPWPEGFWQDVHATLLVYARDQLNAELPPGLHARVDERLAIDAEGERARTYVPDVAIAAIAESWVRSSGPVLGQGGAAVAAAEPTIVDFGEQVLRRLEIVDSRAHIVTTIELLSPSNKADPEAVLNWRRKRNDYVRGGINLVEIDLLRGGAWTLPDRSLLKPVPLERVCYHVCVTRPPWLTRHEFDVLPLRERLPPFACRCASPTPTWRWICSSWLTSATNAAGTRP